MPKSGIQEGLEKKPTRRLSSFLDEAFFFPFPPFLFRRNRGATNEDAVQRMGTAVGLPLFPSSFFFFFYEFFFPNDRGFKMKELREPDALGAFPFHS